MCGPGGLRAPVVPTGPVERAGAVAGLGEGVGGENRARTAQRGALRPFRGARAAQPFQDHLAHDDGEDDHDHHLEKVIEQKVRVHRSASSWAAASARK